ncbi:MAG TPA: AtpZ/AtpI family protein [Gemmataceae bacterium]|nr:AtpZ/AtpI family protein [Gemmataceae bacterium]
MSQGKPTDDPFVREIRRQAERARIGRHVTFWQGLGLVGAIGWMVSLPAVLGALLGRWLDARSASGIFWTLSLLTAGLALGCASAWRRARRELKG